MIDLGLKQKKSRFNNVEKELLTLFHSTSIGKSNKNFRFAMVDSNFLPFLPHLNDGAVRLYLYYALHANNNSGELWHSIETISQKLGVSDRSVGNWNKQLEDLGLIYRTGDGKRSKTTFILPLTSFAVKMSESQMNQIFTEMNLYDSNAQTKIFGKVQSTIRLFVKNEAADAVNEVVVIHLNKSSLAGNVVLNSVDIFIYDMAPSSNKDVGKKILEFAGEGKVVIVDDDKEIMMGKKTVHSSKCFFINEPFKIDDASVYHVMKQLTGDVDFSELAHISF